MTTRIRLGGIYAAVLTPFDRDFRPCPQTSIPYYRELLAQGCAGLNVLGTTGEAMSVGLRDRLDFMEAVAAALPRERLMVGTGAAALADAARLTHAAFDLGYAAALIIPPFYYRDATGDGIVRYFAAVFERAQPPAASVALYNFPRMSGITLHAELVDRLLREFPGIVCGFKDSSNTLSLEREIRERHPELAVFPGSEALLREARESDLAGCISGSVCLWPDLAASAWRDGGVERYAELAARRAALSDAPLIRVVRGRVAQKTGDPGWNRAAPPLT